MSLRLPPLNEKSGTPKYEQIANWLIDAVKRGDYQPDTRLPAVDDLVEAAGVAKMTARKALQVTAQRGYGRLVPGMGYYVPLQLPDE